MGITLFQGVLLALIALIAGIDAFMEGFFFFRPIVIGAIAGMILGDWQMGVICGGLTEIAYTGLTPVGGTQPPNPVIAGIMAPVFVHVSGITPMVAIPLTWPFALLMQYCILFYYSSFSFFMPRVQRAIDEGNIQGIQNVHYLTNGIVGITYALIIFLSTFLIQDQMRIFVEAMPNWLIHGFEIAGGVLPAVGFALLLRMVLKKEFIAYLIIGLLFASFIEMPNLLPVALLGVAFALLEYFRSINVKQPAAIGVFEGDEEDGI